MAFSYIPPAPEGSPKGEQRDRAREMAQPVTPLSDRLRAGYGSLEMSLQTVPGLCKERKCIQKEGHTAPCWPGD